MSSGQQHKTLSQGRWKVSAILEAVPWPVHMHSGMYMPSLTPTCISAHIQAYKYMNPSTHIYTNAKKYLIQAHTQTYNSTQIHIIKKSIFTKFYSLDRYLSICFHLQVEANWDQLGPVGGTSGNLALSSGHTVSWVCAPLSWDSGDLLCPSVPPPCTGGSSVWLSAMLCSFPTLWKKPACVREVLAQASQLLMDLGLLPPLVVLGTGMAFGWEATQTGLRGAGNKQPLTHYICHRGWPSPQ